MKKIAKPKKSAIARSNKKPSSKKNKFDGMSEEKLYTAIYRFANVEDKPTIEKLFGEFGVLKRKNAKKKTAKKKLNKIVRKKKRV